MFRDTLEVHKNERRFEIVAHPFYPVGHDNPDVLYFRPMVYEILDKNHSHVVTLESEKTSENAIQAGFEFIKKF